jgi:hypothetical protein
VDEWKPEARPDDIECAHHHLCSSTTFIRVRHRSHRPPMGQG